MLIVCGIVLNVVGLFFCFGDEIVYIDLIFF